MTYELTWIDWVALVVILCSTLLSLLRGLMLEVASLAVWVLAIVAGSRLARYVADPLKEWLAEPLALTLGFLLIVLVVLLLGRLVTLTLKEIVRASGASVLDRLLGAVFGALRGLVIMAVLAVLGAMTPLTAQPEWQRAYSRSALEWSIQVLTPWMPSFVSSRIPTDLLKGS
jgi:membrane protein required for colicin V production